MRVVDVPGGRPVHVWARKIPGDALAQLSRVAKLPFVVEHVAAMPDLHVANGVSVGTVFATEGELVPSALGGDLGCGVVARRIVGARAPERSDLERILSAWASVIPVGDAVHRRGAALPLDEPPLSTGSLQHARGRLGPRHFATLGGGNHFVELDRDPGGGLWLLVHSGSRGLGSVVAAHHQAAAAAAAFSKGAALPHLRVDSEEGRACRDDYAWCLRFARANREALLDVATGVACELLGGEADASSLVDVHHNYVAEELHFGRTLWVHRKGAIRAGEGERAIIPGSMGTASYLVEGRGAEASFRSASHGAGRVMSRREAREAVKLPRFAASMRRVVYDERRSTSLVEEAPAAYRDIREVLEDEEDLVAPVLRLEPLAVLKG